MVTKAIPDSPEALLETLSSERRTELLNDPEAWKGFIRDYTAKTIQRDPELQAQLKEARELGIKEYLSKNGYEPVKTGRVPLSPEAIPNAGYSWDPDYRKQLLQRANAQGEWKTFGEFLRGMNQFLNRGGSYDARLKANNENDPGSGGFTVPDEFLARLLMLALEPSIIRPRAFVLPMSSQSIRIPAIRDSSHASTVFGGVQAYWTAESGAVTESNPTFRQVQLTARKLTGYTTTSNELLADNAISLEALLIRMFGEALAYFEDVAFINGTGAGQPLGILNAGALVSVAKETGQAATSLVAANLDKMYSRMLPSSMNKAIWIANPDVFPQLAALSRAVGTGGSSVWMMNMAGGPPSSIYGRPIIFSEKCQTLGTAGDIFFVDLSYYLIGDRMSMEMASSPHVRFTNDETVHRFVQRVDGQPWIDVALTPRFGTNTLSPIVALATRA